MGLEYFAQTCSADATLEAATTWCVAKEGTCCAVCPNTLASIGTRVGLTCTVLFATLVTVSDAAEASYGYMSTVLQALAYLLTIMQQGLFGSGVSRFHAYYALFCSLGFLSPLAAASVTGAHFLAGKKHADALVLLDMLFGRQLPQRSLSKRLRHWFSPPPARTQFGCTTFNELGSSNPFFSGRTRQHKPLLAPDTTTPEPSPVIRPARDLSRRSSRSRSARSRPYRLDDEEAALSSPDLPASDQTAEAGVQLRSSRTRSLHTSQASDRRPSLASSPHHHSSTRATPSSLFDHPPSAQSTPLSRHSTTDSHRSTGGPRQEGGSEPESLTLPEPAQPVKQLRSWRRRKGDRSKLRKAQRAADDADRAEPTVAKEKSPRKGEWRRWAMLLANFSLLVLWIITFLLVRGVVGSFTLIQTDCTDPSGTQLLETSTMVFLVLALIICVLYVLKLARFSSFSSFPLRLIPRFCSYSPTFLHKHVKRVFAYTKSDKDQRSLTQRERWTAVLVPVMVGGVVFATWQALLWTAYSLAAQPDSSLLAVTEETATFPTVLSLALCARSATDLVKAIYRARKRKHRSSKDTAKQNRTPALAAQTSSAVPSPRPTHLAVPSHHLDGPLSPIRHVPSLDGRIFSSTAAPLHHHPSAASRRSSSTHSHNSSAPSSEYTDDTERIPMREEPRMRGALP
ncbi:hypothetical protein JCM10207_001967 [Rhodosporidiobolus poonsookiae]